MTTSDFEEFVELLRRKDETKAIEKLERVPELIMQVYRNENYGIHTNVIVLAIMRRCLRTLDWILNNYDVASDELHGFTYLQFACESVAAYETGNASVAEIFLYYGADPNVETSSGENCLTLIYRPGSPKDVDTMLRYGATLYRKEFDALRRKYASAIPVKMGRTKQTYTPKHRNVDSFLRPLYERKRRLNVFWLFWFRLPVGSIRTLLECFF